MKYYIRTTGERQLDESYNQIEYELLLDKDHGYVNFFIDQLERVGVEDCVIIEDDCVLCKDFDKRVKEAVSKYPNKIINFFTFPGTEYYITRESKFYLQNQCTYYPKGLSIKLAQEMRKVYKEFSNLATDRIEHLALKNLGETHIHYRPCLVQHLNFHSILGHKTEYEGLRTPFFIDYLDKLNLNYKHLSMFDRKRLIIEMKYDIERRRKKRGGLCTTTSEPQKKDN